MHVSERTKERFPQTFEDVVNAEIGFTFLDEFEEGVRFAILRGPYSLCAYVGHSGDFSTYDHGRADLSSYKREETQWTPAMVFDDSWEARWEFKRLVGLAEKIARRAWQPEGVKA